MSAQHLRAAYARATGISITKVKAMDDEITSTMQKALNLFSSTLELLPGETEEMKKERLACKSARQGDTTELGMLFQRNFFSNDKEVSGPEAIFRKYMEVEGKMETKGSTTSAIEALKGEIGGTTPTTPVVTGDANPATPKESKPVEAEVSKAESAAAAKLLLEEAPTRDAWSAGSVVESVILSKQNNKDLIDYKSAKVQGEGEAKVVMGKIYDPAKQLRNFKEKFGVVTTAEGVQFRNVATGSEDDARDIYNMLVEAAAGQEKELEVYFSETEGSIAGFKIKTSDDNTSKVLKSDKVIELILAKGNGVLDIGTKDSGKQLQAAPVKPKTGVNARNAQGTADRNKSVRGLLTLRIANRKDAIEQHKVYLKEATGQIKDLPNVKSSLAAKYKSKTTGTNGEIKNITFRITLLVPMKEIDVVSDELKVLKSEAVRGTQVITTEKAKENLLNATLVMMKNNVQLEFLSKITETAKGIENEETARVADAIGAGAEGLDLE